MSQDLPHAEPLQCTSCSEHILQAYRAPVAEVINPCVFRNPDQPLQGRRPEQGCRPGAGAAAGQRSLQGPASLRQSRRIGARQQRRHNRLYKHSVRCQRWRQLRVAAQVGRNAQQQLREPVTCGQ